MDITLFDFGGNPVGKVSFDTSKLGDKVRIRLLHQAVKMYEASKRLGNAFTKTRGEVAYVKAKPFRQKGTGYARRGAIRTGKVRGGGVTFAKIPHKPSKKLPKKMRRRALDSAILAKIIGSDLLVVEGLSANEPKTRYIADLLKKLQVNRSYL